VCVSLNQSFTHSLTFTHTHSLTHSEKCQHITSQYTRVASRDILESEYIRTRVISLHEKWTEEVTAPVDENSSVSDRLATFYDSMLRQLSESDRQWTRLVFGVEAAAVLPLRVVLKFGRDRAVEVEASLNVSV